jgi:prolyl oligopeptidase
MPLSYPETRREPVIDVLHGVPVADPYRWLEDAGRDDVRAWMDAQDRVAREFLAALPGRERFVRRLAELAYVDAVGVPARRGTRYFYERRRKELEKNVWYWRDGACGVERVLLDPNTMGNDGTLSIGVVAPSHDGATVAYTIRERGGDAATLYVLDVDSGATSGVDVIPGAKYASPEWLPDGSGFYYTRLPQDPSIAVDQLPGHAEIRFHRLGTPPADDALVHERTGDPSRFLGPSLSYDGRWLFAYVHRGWSAVDIAVRDLADPDGAFRPFVRGEDALFGVVAWQGRFFIQTNQDAPFGRVCVCDAARCADRAAWREIIPERPGSTIESVQVIGGRLAVNYLEDVHGAIEIFALDGTPQHRVPLPGIGSVSSLSGEPDGDEAFFAFTSFSTPTEIHRISVAGRDAAEAPALWARAEIPVDPQRIEVRQVWFRSRDGTRVPMFVVHAKGLDPQGDAPAILTGYGGFATGMEPAFSSLAVAWAEAGGVFAVANLRGGNEFGEDWHRAGMRGNKQNVFDDFIAAAEALIAQGVTRPGRLAIFGGSNGGLLVGAAMVQRPELFRAVLCAVPLLDMLRFHLFGSGRTWVDEYGSAEDAGLFPVLHGYSPYHQVASGTRYPALLMLSADNDDRVDPMHARKFVAAVQHAQAAEHPALLRVERDAGHGGSDLRRKTVEQFADTLAFALHELR